MHLFVREACRTLRIIEMKNLIKKYLEESISPDEQALLKSWVQQSDENRNLFEKEIIACDARSEFDFDIKVALERFNHSISQKRSAFKVRRLNIIYRYAAVFIGIGALGFMSRALILDSGVKTENLIATAESSQDVDAIVIKLADGTIQILDEDEEVGITDAQGNLVASKKDATLRFEKSSSSVTELVYNEITIPNGKKLKLELSDGSLVWLNSGTYFKFPQQFISSKKTRSVFLVGEAFFEIAKDKTLPFIVNAGELDVKVLGTKFNVSAYEANDAVATTLVEGSVSVCRDLVPEIKTVLVPNEQLRYNIQLKSMTKEIVEVTIYTAWMEGKLIINNLRFKEILRRLERRDDITIINKAKNLDNEMFRGAFKNESVEEVLQTMAISTPFNYSINNKIITITNK
ncbi:MAG: transmembrane sensor [Psychroserpens sp.]|jgi:transmembrane sensor